MAKKISEGRKVAYYVGMGLMVLGFLTFGSVFVTGVMNIGEFNGFNSGAKSFGIRMILGFVMFLGGGILMGIGKEGLAGSGAIIDPKKAREDVEPWSRMTGGIVSDALDESGIDLGKITDNDRKFDFEEKLRKLHKLHEDGILSDKEYQKEKAEILDSI